MTKHATFWNHLAANHGATGTIDLRSHGLDHNDVQKFVAVGALEAASHGTYRATAHPRTLEHRCMLAVVAARQRAVDRMTPVAIARDTAALLWGLEERRHEPDVIHVVVQHNRTPAPNLGWVRVHRSRTLVADQVGRVRGIPATTPVRTIVDQAINRSVPDLREMLARGLRLKRFDLAELSTQLELAGRIRGSARLRLAGAEVDPHAGLVESHAEAAALDAFKAARLYGLVPQYPLELAGQRLRLDFAAPLEKLAVEIDGYWWHSTPEQKARDDRRQNLLAANGWRVLRFGAGLVARRPDAMVTSVQDAMRSVWAP